MNPLARAKNQLQWFQHIEEISGNTSLNNPPAACNAISQRLVQEVITAAVNSRPRHLWAVLGLANEVLLEVHVGHAQVSFQQVFHFHRNQNLYSSDSWIVAWYETDTYHICNRCKCCLVVEWLLDPSLIQHWYKMSAKHQVCLSLSSQEKRMAPVARLFWDHVVLLVPWCLWHWRCQCSQALLWSFNRALGQWNIETNGFWPCAAPLKKNTKKNGSTRCIRKDGFAMGEAYSYLIGIDKKHISCASNPMRIIPRHLPQALRTLFLATMSSSARGASVFAFSHAPTVAQRVEEAVRRNRCNLKPETAICCIEFLCFFLRKVIYAPYGGVLTCPPFVSLKMRGLEFHYIWYCSTNNIIFRTKNNLKLYLQHLHKVDPPKKNGPI